jgi:tetratricopeptide (TPR) repeat protein
MADAESALKALLERMRRAAEKGGTSALLSTEATQEAEDLAAATDPSVDVKAAALLGMFHWGRYLALPEGDDQDDFAAAASYLRLIYRTNPEAVPPDLREHYQRQPDGETEADSDASSTTRRALERLSGYRRTGEIRELMEAVTLFRAALAATPRADPVRGRRLSNLSAALRMLSEQTQDEAELEEAIQTLRDAVAVTPDNDEDRAKYLSNLCAALVTSAGRTDGTRIAELLIEAVQAGREAVAAASSDDPDRGSMLSGLGSALTSLSGSTGQVTLLAEAADAHRKAVEATPDGHPRYAICLANLATTLLVQFERTWDTALLGEAEQINRAAVAAIPHGHPDRPGIQFSLGNVLIRLSERTGQPGPLAEGIAAQRAAIVATPAGNPYRAIYLSGLGSSLRLLAETGGEALLAEAVSAYRDALAAVPRDHPDRAGHLFNLGTALQSLGERTDGFRLLAEAVYALRASVTGTLGASPERTVRLSALGDALQALSAKDDDPALLTEARDCYAQASHSTGAPIPVRIWAYRQLAQLTDPRDALTAIEAAVALLPLLIPRALSRHDRAHQAGLLAGLAGEAAAAAVSAGQPERAAELLEQTRGLLVADALRARSGELARLGAAAPELSDELEQLRIRLDALSVPATPPSYAGDPGAWAAYSAAGAVVQARQDAQADWDELIGRIRARPGFGGFLHPPKVTQLAAQACDGPVVLVYSSPRGCGALALSADAAKPVQAIPLDLLTEDAVRGHANQLIQAYSAQDYAACAMAQRKIPAILEWIWDTITEPILAGLGYTTTPVGQAWPHIWWCPVGVLAYLPLHAAGHHADVAAADPGLYANPRTALDRVISSYTSTVQSLGYARNHAPDQSQDTMLIVSVPRAPGVPPLPQVAAEASAIARLVPGARTLNHPDKTQVLAALPHHWIAHFACHGYADWADPAASQLILPDHQTAPLTVADIAARQIASGLAYLSACETAVTSQKLADETVHLMGAFHLAGYQHVIGTLWPIDDTAARELAVDFYASITPDTSAPPRTDRAAAALHHATRVMRARHPYAPIFWASHIHAGA